MISFFSFRNLGHFQLSSRPMMTAPPPGSDVTFNTSVLSSLQQTKTQEKRQCRIHDQLQGITEESERNFYVSLRSTTFMTVRHAEETGLHCSNVQASCLAFPIT